MLFRSKGLQTDTGDEGAVRPVDRNGAFEARHLSKYVFPLQYNLDNVFWFHPERSWNEQFMRFRFLNREDEIKVNLNRFCYTEGLNDIPFQRLNGCKTPSRLKATLPLLAQLYSRHAKCGYKPLLDTVCPSKASPASSLGVSHFLSDIIPLSYVQFTETRRQTEAPF